MIKIEKIKVEGSPMSPVFKTKEQLALWCEHNATIFGSEKMTYKKWLDFITTQNVILDMKAR